MANKNPLGEGKFRIMPPQPPLYEDTTKAHMTFNKAVYELGLKLIEDYRTGKCSDRTKTLEAITEIFRVSNNFARPFFNGGIIDEFGI